MRGRPGTPHLAPVGKISSLDEANTHKSSLGTCSFLFMLVFIWPWVHAAGARAGARAGTQGWEEAGGNIPQQGLDRPSASCLKHSGQSPPCPQAWGWEVSGQ